MILFYEEVLFCVVSYSGLKPHVNPLKLEVQLVKVIVFDVGLSQPDFMFSFSKRDLLKESTYFCLQKQFASQCYTFT